MASLLCRHNADLPIERLIETLEHAMVHAGTSAASRNLAEINERGLVAKMMPPGLQEVSALIPHFTPAPRSFVLELRHECPPHSGCPTTRVSAHPGRRTAVVPATARYPTCRASATHVYGVGVEVQRQAFGFTTSTYPS